MATGRNAWVWLALFGLLAGAAATWLVLSGGGSGRDFGSPGGAPAAPDEDAFGARDRRDPSRPASGAAPGALAGAGELRGRLVRGLPPSPIPGTVVISSGEAASAEVEAGADGRFSIPDLPVGEPLELLARSAGAVPARIPSIRIPASLLRDLGDVVLGPGQELEVSVLDAAGAPVAGAAVRILRRPPSGPWSDWIGRRLEPAVKPDPIAGLETGDAGTAVFPSLPPGRLEVVATADGFAAARTSVSLEEGRAREPVRLILRPGFPLSGLVVDHEGEPVPGLAVGASPSGGSWYVGDFVGTTTDETGAYRLEGLAEGVQTVSVRHGATAFLTVGSVRVPAVDRFDIHLVEGGTLDGRVLADATGEPVEGATVTLNRALTGTGYTARVLTDGEGRFEFRGVPPGPMGQLTVAKDGFLAWPDGSVENGPNQRTIRTGAVTAVETRLRRGTSLSGRVLTDAGEPVADARVQLWSLLPNGSLTQSDTVPGGADGSYRIESVEPGTRGLLLVRSDRYVQPDFPRNPWEALNSANVPEAWSVTIPEEGEATRDVVLAAGAALEGSAALVAGAPAAGFAVSATPAGEPGWYGWTPPTATVAPDGRFRLEGLAPGVAIEVRVTGPSGRVGSAGPFTLEEGEVRKGVEIRVGAAATIAGHLRREDGRGLRGVRLRLATGTLDPNQPWNWEWRERSAVPQPVTPGGAFEIPGLAAGEYTLIATAPGAAEARLEVEVSEGEQKLGLELALPAGFAVRGVVVDLDGRPVPGAMVSVERAERPNTFMYSGLVNVVADAVTDASGAFAVDGLAEGPVRIRVTAPGWVDGGANARAGATGVKVELSRGAAIAGVVVDRTTGEPIPDVPVWASPARPVPGLHLNSHQARTDESGRFRLEGLAPGAWNLTVGQQWGTGGLEYRPESVSGVEAGTEDLRVELVRGLSITGRFVDDRGETIPGQRWIQAIGRDANGNPDWSRQRSTRSEADGTFVLGGLEPGTWDLTVSTPGYGGAYAPTRRTGIAAGATDLAIVLVKGLPISGRVVDREGEPWTKGGWISVSPSGGGAAAAMGSTAMAQVSPDGTFRTQPLDTDRTWDLSFSGPQGGLPARVEGVRPGTDDVVIERVTGGTIEGIVLDDEGRPVGAGVPVRATTEGTGAGRGGFARTDADGRFVIENLAPGTFRVGAGGSGSEWRVTWAAARFSPGATGVTIRLERGVVITGRVVSPSGSLPERVTLGAVDPETNDLLNYARVEADGTFRLEGLPAGPVKFRAWLPTGTVDCGASRAPATDVTVTLPE